MFRKRTPTTELGVELELEGFPTNKSIKRNLPRRLRCKYFLSHAIDESVKDAGTEIVFRHMELEKWHPADIAEICGHLAKSGLRPGETAGMHIHYSGPKINSLYDVYQKETDYMDTNKTNNFLSNLFLAIGARKGYSNGAFMYGIDYDWAALKEKDSKTIEIRAFESTLNPNILYSRLCVTRYILDYAAVHPYENLSETMIQNMPESIGKQLWFLTTTENPNKYGLKPSAILQKLRKDGRQI